MEFGNPIVGQEELIRQAIRSRNYAQGSSGWKINRNGAAEFSEITLNFADAQGSVEIGNSRIYLYDNDSEVIAAMSAGEGPQNDSGVVAYYRPSGSSTVYAIHNAGYAIKFYRDDDYPDSPGEIAYSNSDYTSIALNISSGWDVRTGGFEAAELTLTAGTGTDEPLINASGVFSTDNHAFGRVTISPVANTPTSVTVTGLSLRGTEFYGFATARTTVPGSTVYEASVTGETSSQLIVWVYRDNITNTPTNWQVWSK